MIHMLHNLALVTLDPIQLTPYSMYLILPYHHVQKESIA